MNPVGARYRFYPVRNAVQGFTLIEILAVVLIIGLGIGIVSFNIGGNRPLTLRNEAHQFSNQIAVVAADAAFDTTPWGLQFYRQVDDGEEVIAWRWLHFRDPSNTEVSADPKSNKKALLGWQPEAPRDLEAGGHFSAEVTAVLEIEGHEVPIELLSKTESPETKNSETKNSGKNKSEKSGPSPDVWLTAGGEMTPFALHLNFVGEQGGPIVRGDAIGRVDVETGDPAVDEAVSQTMGEAANAKH